MNIGIVVMGFLLVFLLFQIFFALGGADLVGSFQGKSREQANLSKRKDNFSTKVQEAVGAFVSHKAAKYSTDEEKWEKLAVSIRQLGNEITNVVKIPEEKKLRVQTEYAEIEVEVNF